VASPLAILSRTSVKLSRRAALAMLALEESCDDERAKTPDNRQLSRRVSFFPLLVPDPPLQQLLIPELIRRCRRRRGGFVRLGLRWHWKSCSAAMVGWIVRFGCRFSLSLHYDYGTCHVSLSVIWCFRKMIVYTESTLLGEVSTYMRHVLPLTYYRY